jgi:selenocysteine lyase/cysteine desulfurase
MLDFKNVRENTICKKESLYLDFTASGLAYKPIEKKIQNILKTYANTHSEYGEHAQKTSGFYAQARSVLHDCLEVDKKDFYILPSGTGTTGAIKKFQEITGLYIPPATRVRLKSSTLKKQKPLVIVGPYEHHSNEVSYRESLAEVIRVPLKKGKIDFIFIEKVLKENQGREIYGSFSAASNVTGVLTPVKKISKILRKYGAFVCFDAATSSAHENIDSGLYDAMFLSPHKLIGGVSSCGLLVISKKFFENYKTPTFCGGGTVDYVSNNYQNYLDEVEETENAGTPGILQLVRAAEAYSLRNSLGLDLIRKKEEELKEYFFSKTKGLKDFVLYEEKNKDRLPIFSFNVKGFGYHQISRSLSDDFFIQTRSGCSCAGPYGHDILGIEQKKDGYKNEEKPGWVRVGFSYIHTKKDIDYFFKSLKKVVEKNKK